MIGRSSPCRVLLVDADLRLSDRLRPLFDSGDLVPSRAPCMFADAADQVRRQEPDILLLDLSGPDALAAIEAVMAEFPRPILLLKSRNADVEPFTALAMGALDLEELPEHPSAELWQTLARKLVLLSSVRVVRHVRGRKRRAGPPPPSADPVGPPFPLVAIASSLGGPKALCTLLRMVPKTFPAPITICQHISDGFTGGLAHWLAAETSLHVVEARDGQELAAGTVFIAPSRSHLLVGSNFRLKLDDGPPLMGFKPSCNALLFSAAEAFGRRCMGVVLTGMGKDGARGLKEIRVRGGRTIAQDESTSVVYGMPKEAMEIGAAETVLPLEEIASALIRLVGTC